MCDYQYNASPWTNFYHHYLQQHAIMTQHFQRLNNLDSYYTGCGTCCSHSHNPANVCSPMEHSSCSSYSTSSESYSSNTPSESYNTNTVSSEYEIEQDNEEAYEDDETEYEYELNVDAILAMRAAKEELKKETLTSESDSIVLIDSDKEEDFEFVDLGSIKTLESKLSHGVGGGRNRNEEIHTHKKVMEYLYGEKYSSIAGIEAAMAVNFEHLCDFHQPSLWPVLPLRL